jgi:C1A family cysteine protease
MQLILLVATLLFCGVCTASKPGRLTLAQTSDLFQAWKLKYSKAYVTDTEEAYRFKAFQQTLIRIERNNAKGNAVFGLTKFSDLTPIEFKQLLGYVPRNQTTNAEVFDRSGVAAPTSFDWSKTGVTPVKDQGQCGSCWAFSIVENIESVWLINKKISPSNMPALSPQEVVDCDTSDAGCNGGDPPTAYAYVISAGGLESNSDYPYTAEDGQCSFDASKVKVTISGWKYATQSTDESAMQDALVNWGPLSICVDAEPWQDYTGGILLASQCDTSLDHCVQAVGYDLTKSTPYWLVRNSWGTDWGEAGYIRLQYGQDTCGLADEATSSYV